MQVAYTELTPEQYATAKQFLEENGINYEFDFNDSTWFVALQAPGSTLKALETQVFGAEVS